ncbi:MAG TPA: glutathione S-transferase N-terminal domain-containing protein, partial [Candidatus Acidoferrales bacterium]|nr:glutathione S-transferase N-terminal domain-containing protein [Candidatus Acidoferrales bacterium]
MKLYHSAQSRSVRPRWLLEELGVPFELVRLDLGKQEHKTPAYMKIHPHGAVPALVDDDLKMI